MKNKALTLIELLVVIIIIAIIASFIVLNTSNSLTESERLDILGTSNNLKSKNLDYLVSEWKFDGPTQAGSIATNDDVKDSWGYNNGNVVGHAPTVLDGEDCVSGKCLDFDGSNYVQVQNSSSLNFDSDEFTIEMWAKMDTHSDSTVLITKSSSCSAWGAVGYAFTTISSPNEVYFMWAGTCCGINTGLENPDGTGFEWTHIVGIRKEIGNPCKAYAEFYKNGKYIGRTENGTCDLSISNTADLFIGKKSGCNGLDGTIDEVKIYSKALDISDINNNYIAGLNSLMENGAISQEEYNQRLNNIAQK